MLDTANNDNKDKSTPKTHSPSKKSTGIKPSFPNKKIEDFFSLRINGSKETKEPKEEENKKEKSEESFLQKKREKPKENETKEVTKENNQTCSICRDGGELIMCDGCPRSFHCECLKINLSDLPEGNWYCPKCKETKKKKKISSSRSSRKKGKENSPTLSANGNSEAKEKKKKSKKAKSKKFSYPMKDSELYENSSQHKLTKEQIEKSYNKENLFNIELPFEVQNQFITAYDFSFSFANHLQLNVNFTLEQFVESVYSKAPSEVYETVLSSLLYIFITEIKDKSYEDLSYEQSPDTLKLVKFIFQNTNSKNFIFHYQCKLVPLIMSSKRPNSNYASLTEEQVLALTPPEKIGLISEIISLIYDTPFFRDILKEDLNKKASVKKVIRDLEEESRVIESRKKELERQEQFTQPKAKLEKLNTELTNLETMSEKLSRKEINQKRKKLEKEISVIKSELKEHEIVQKRKSEIMVKIKKEKEELHSISSVSTHSKYLGTDYKGNRYYYFNWGENFVLKEKDAQGYQWKKIVMAEKDNVEEILGYFTEKGISEKKLIEQIKAIDIQINANDNNLTQDDSQKVCDILASKAMAIEEKFSNYFQREYNAILDTEVVMEELKQNIKVNNSLENIRNFLYVSFKKMMSPSEQYEKKEVVKKKMIIDDEEDEIIPFSLINKETNSIDVEKGDNPNIVKLKYKIKLFSKEQEFYQLDKLYLKEFESKCSVANVYLLIYFLEALYNEVMRLKDPKLFEGDSVKNNFQ